MGGGKVSIKNAIKNAQLLGNTCISYGTNVPAQYASQQKKYFHHETATFAQMYAKYASDFIEVEAQGLEVNEPQKWTKTLARFTDVVHPSAITTKNPDDYKQIFIADRAIEYIRQGTKFVTMGSTWLATFTGNLSGGDGKAMVQRCNTVWNYLDYYGNVHSEPMITERMLASANENAERQSVLIAKGYFTIKCQYNENTAQLDTNSRMILGTGCYHITGYSDFETEFTGDYSTVRLLAFTARYEEPNKEIDDMENHVAGGKMFSWDIKINGIPTLNVSESYQYSATSIRNGETVSNTEAYPVTYNWTTSNPDIATVTQDGTVTAIGQGQCTITATLAQNPTITKSFPLSVVTVSAEPHIEFLETINPTLKPYETQTIKAAYFENGEKTDKPLTWTTSGADKDAYTVIASAGNYITIKCWGYSAKPLTIEASYNNQSATTTISLEGF